MRLQLELTPEEWATAYDCLTRRYEDLKRKVRAGGRKGWSMEGYQREARILEKFLLQMGRETD